MIISICEFHVATHTNYLNMKTFKIYPILILAILAWSCSKDMVQPTELTTNTENSLKSAKPKMKIAVMSDIHYLDPALMTGNPSTFPTGDFQTYLNSDPKLLEFSNPILRKAIAEIVASKPDVLLIPGDLTKDGELINHQAVATMLEQVSAKGIKVFVVPGNHDIANPEAVHYIGAGSEPEPSISASDFADIYEKFGYQDAIYRDSHSLSYVCEPFNNVWVLGIDDCIYPDLQIPGKANIAGVIKPETRQWIQDRLAEATKKNITVLAMMHHGLVEHYTGQQSLDNGYVTANWEATADALIDAGLRVIFTGHYHANDITSRSKGTNTVFDIETGSLVTPPSPYRIITSDPNYLYVDTKHVTTIDAPIPYGLPFVSYSNGFLSAHLDGIFTYMLNVKYGVPAPSAVGWAPFFTEAMMAHYAGDENLTHEVPALPPPLNGALYSLWSDLPPSDNQFTVDMRKKIR